MSDFTIDINHYALHLISQSLEESKGKAIGKHKDDLNHVIKQLEKQKKLL